MLIKKFYTRNTSGKNIRVTVAVVPLVDRKFDFWTT